MGFSDNQASLQTATSAGDLALATNFDGYVPPPPPPSPVALPPVPLSGGTLATSTAATAPAAAAAASAKPSSFWSGIGDALHSGATWLGEHVEVRAQLSTSATPVTPYAIAPRPAPPHERWTPWLIGAAVAGLLLLLLRR